MLERANDPTPLLEADWGTRQKQLAALNESGTLWSTYGADKHAFDKVLDELDALGIPTFYDKDAPANGQYVSSPESRTIWVQVDETSFTKLFGPSAALKDGGENALGEPVIFWEGDLNLPKSMVDAGVKGLWFDTGALETPILADPGSGPEATLQEGAQSPGNSVRGGEYPNEIAARYNFPFASDEYWTSVETGRIGLIEPGLGTALPATATGTFDELLKAYRASAGIDDPPTHVLSVAGGGQEFTDGDENHDERALDVGVVSAVNPAVSAHPLCRVGSRQRRRPGRVHRLSVGDLGHGPQSRCGELLVHLLPARQSGVALLLRPEGALHRRRAPGHHHRQCRRRRRLGRRVPERLHEHRYRPTQVPTAWWSVAPR